MLPAPDRVDRGGPVAFPTTSLSVPASVPSGAGPALETGVTDGGMRTGSRSEIGSRSPAGIGGRVDGVGASSGTDCARSTDAMHPLTSGTATR